MKKITVWILSMICCFALVACATNSNSASNFASSSESASEYPPSVYTIYYDIGTDSYAEIESDSQEVAYNEALRLYEPTRYGYTFSGWLYKDTSQPFTLETYTIEGDTYLVASWTVDSDSDRWFTPDI